MQLGFHLTPFFSPSERPPTQILDEVIQVVRAASTLGYACVHTAPLAVAPDGMATALSTARTSGARDRHDAPEDLGVTPAVTQSAKSPRTSRRLIT